MQTVSPRNIYRLSDISLRIHNYSLHAITKQPGTKALAVLGESTRPTASSTTENANLFTDKTNLPLNRLTPTLLIAGYTSLQQDYTKLTSRSHKDIGDTLYFEVRTCWDCCGGSGCGQIKAMSREGQKST